MFKNPTELVPSAVQLLRFPDVGVPSTGVVKDGLVANATTVPLPVVV
jgi:hypothetical protein